MYRKAVINGRLTRDIKVNDSGKSGFMSIASDDERKNQQGERESNFFSVFLRGEKNVAFAAQYLHKGDGVVVECEMKTRPSTKYFDAENHPCQEIVLLCDHVGLGAVGQKSKAERDAEANGSAPATNKPKAAPPAGNAPKAAPPAPAPQDPSDFEELPDDDDLPF